ncbi:EamA family transporter [Lactiplantibacillus plantarum]|uniref:DMT family transporter n=1 Tax=Lactiplantibacillus plantarum TaxID=1590 RepID=UPI001F4C46A3|nr:EamA family transporter [Lactiplantibacillus plantarum]UNB86954.1 DMT family transporter [Lactiplantibacillus plantarum]
MQKKTVGLLLASAGPFLWGSSGTVAQHLFDTTTISPLWLVAVRMLVSGGLLILYGFSRRLPVIAVFHDWRATVRLIVFSLFGMAGVQLTYFMAISTGNAAMAAILQFLSPVMIIIFITATTWQLPGKVDVISVVSAIIWGLLAAVGATIYTLMPTKLLKVYGATPIVGWSMLIGGGLVLVGTGAWHHSPQLTWVAWGQVGFVVIFGTMLAYLFFLQSLEYILPTTASVLGAIEPLAATILSVLFLHVHFNWVGLLGAIMIVGVTILQFAATRANQFVSK